MKKNAIIENLRIFTADLGDDLGTSQGHFRIIFERLSKISEEEKTEKTRKTIAGVTFFNYVKPRYISPLEE